MANYLVGYKTATLGTEITAICPPNSDKVPVLRGFSYTTLGTEHNLYVMSPLGVTSTISYTTAADTTMDIATLDPGKTTAGIDEDLAAADWVLYQTKYGNIEARKISSISGTTLTFATGPTDDVNTGAKVWACYEAGRPTNYQIRLPASTTRTFDNLYAQGGIPHQKGIQMSVTGSGMPMLVVIDNPTAAGKLDYASFEWVDAEHNFSK